MRVIDQLEHRFAPSAAIPCRDKLRVSGYPESIGAIGRCGIMRSVACLALAACMSRSAIGTPLSNTSTESPSLAILVPTLATAGAATCKLDKVVELGRWGGTPIHLAFDGALGLAAWRRDDIDDAGHHLVQLQRLASDGTKVGAERILTVDELEDVVRVTPRSGEIEVVIASSDAKTRPWAVFVDRAGQMTERREPRPAPRLESSTAKPLLVTITDDGVPTPAGASRVGLMRPALHRTVDGEPIGTPLALTYRDKPITEVDSIFTYHAWSGTHVLYPFWTTVDKPPYYIEADWFLLPIDCRP